MSRNAGTRPVFAHTAQASLVGDPPIASYACPPTFLITGDCPSPLSVLIAIIYVALWANVAADALLTATAAVVVTATTAVTRVTLAAAADLRVHLSSTLGTSASGSLAVLR